MNPFLILLLLLIALGFGAALALLIQRARRNSAESSIRAMLAQARQQSDSIVKEGKLQAKEELLQARDLFEQDMKRRRDELSAYEDRLAQRDATLDRRLEQLDRKESALELRHQQLADQQAAFTTRQHELDTLQKQKVADLERISGLTAEQASRELRDTLEAEVRAESSALIRRLQQEAHETAERDARKIIALAIERYASEQVNEMTTCVIPLPGDEMKGRIIGKEGRNIRALEAATGINILIDDTPGVVIVSGFDPMRREIAKRALERLISDGRIHPSRIEEAVAKVQSELDLAVKEAGEEAAFALHLDHLAPEVLRMTGRLKFRHSYGQNVLKHSLEMGHLMGMMAAELSLDPAIARRVGLLHDIGKAMDHDIDGSHALIGADFLRRHGEAPLVCNAVAAHHNEVEAESIYAILARAADTITAARPGARSETTEIYLKRLEKLEQIANSYRGVEKSFAVHAGREIRVFVEPHHINDDEALQMARNISKQIEHDLQYPGQIKVTVVRETRCVEYAR
ncbi:MAG TPA: ribonuclease Y [Kiritimatiellia bacterium]|nr:ribonuclease Y [Kiritimatiellia bacterium]